VGVVYGNPYKAEEFDELSNLRRKYYCCTEEFGVVNSGEQWSRAGKSSIQTRKH
jgi:hypothetical protein